MDYLFSGMYAGISTPCTDDGKFMVGNPGKRLFQTALHGTTGLLALPAVKIRTVILDTQCDAHIFARTIRTGF